MLYFTDIICNVLFNTFQIFIFTDFYYLQIFFKTIVIYICDEFSFY